MAHLIFHLNVVADPAVIRANTQSGIARFLAERYGKERLWFKAYSLILADWESYHADLNFSGEDGMADMREARFRIMRALFRLTGTTEPSQDEIHQLADEALTEAYRECDILFQESHEMLCSLAEKHSISLVSYFPQIQLEAMLRASNLQANVRHFIGADTFERYDMNFRYFKMLLVFLNAKADECLFIDKAPRVLGAASELGMRTFAVEPQQDSKNWSQDLMQFIAQEMP